MDEILNDLLRETILTAQKEGHNPEAAAQKAGQAYAAGLIAFGTAVTPAPAPSTAPGSTQ